MVLQPFQERGFGCHFAHAQVALFGCIRNDVLSRLRFETVQFSFNSSLLIIYLLFLWITTHVENLQTRRRKYQDT